jgi:hypothetical protein
LNSAAIVRVEAELKELKLDAVSKPGVAERRKHVAKVVRIVRRSEE